MVAEMQLIADARRAAAAAAAAPGQAPDVFNAFAHALAAAPGQAPAGWGSAAAAAPGQAPAGWGSAAAAAPGQAPAAALNDFAQALADNATAAAAGVHAPSAWGSAPAAGSQVLLRLAVSRPSLVGGAPSELPKKRPASDATSQGPPAVAIPPQPDMASALQVKVSYLTTELAGRDGLIAKLKQDVLDEQKSHGVLFTLHHEAKDAAQKAVDALKRLQLETANLQTCYEGLRLELETLKVGSVKNLADLRQACDAEKAILIAENVSLNMEKASWIAEKAAMQAQFASTLTGSNQASAAVKAENAALEQRLRALNTKHATDTAALIAACDADKLAHAHQLEAEKVAALEELRTRLTGTGGLPASRAVPPAAQAASPARARSLDGSKGGKNTPPAAGAGVAPPAASPAPAPLASPAPVPPASPRGRAGKKPTPIAGAGPTPAATASAGPTPAATASAGPTPAATASVPPVPPAQPALPAAGAKPTPAATPGAGPTPGPAASAGPTPAATASAPPVPPALPALPAASAGPTPAATASVPPVPPAQPALPAASAGPTPAATPGAGSAQTPAPASAGPASPAPASALLKDMHNASGVFSPTMCIALLREPKVEAATFVSVMEGLYGVLEHGYPQAVQDIQSLCLKENIDMGDNLQLLMVPCASYDPGARMGLDAMRDGTMAFDINYPFAVLVPDNCTLAAFLEVSRTYISKLDRSADPDFTREFVMCYCICCAILKASASFPSFATFMHSAHTLFRLMENLAAQERAGSP